VIYDSYFVYVEAEFMLLQNKIVF